MMAQAVMTNTNPSFANLTGAHLSNADMTDANLTSAVLTNAEYNESTVFPSGDTDDVSPWGLPGGISPWDARMIPVPEPSIGWSSPVLKTTSKRSDKPTLPSTTSPPRCGDSR